MSVVEKEITGLEEKQIEWELSGVQAVYRDGEPIKFLVSMPILTIVNMMENSSLIYNPLVQRGVKINLKGQEIPISSKSKILDRENLSKRMCFME